MFKRDIQYYKFCLYGFFKNLRFFDPFLILFLLSKDISFLEIGILYSVKEVIIMIMEIPSGIISDALGRKKTLIISFIAYIISFIIFYSSSNYITILMAMIAFAFADAFRTGVHKAMIFQYLKVNNWGSYKVDYYGKTRSWSQSGSAISAVIAAFFVYFSGNYEIIFLVSIIPYLINMALVFSYPNYLDGEESKTSKNNLKQRFKDIIRAAIISISSFKFLSILTNLSVFTGYYRAVKDYIQPIIVYLAIGLPFFVYMTDEKRIAIIIGFIYSILFTFSAIASKNSGKFTAKFSNYLKPMNITLLIGFVIGVSIGVSTFFDNFIVAIIGFVLIILLENLRKPIGIGLVADISNDKAMATTLSISSQAKSVFAAIMAPLLGYFADLYNPGISVAILSCILILLLPVFWLRKKSK